MDKKNGSGKRAVKDLTAKNVASVKGGATGGWNLAQVTATRS